jgi:SAM-dependent methyltransferase
METNSKEYWENRFATKSWENNGGGAQSVFFVRMAMRIFPKWVVDEINANSLEVCDVGCAEGEGTAYLKEYFPHSKLTGIDFSQTAVDKAHKSFPDVVFKCEDILSLSAKYDVIFISNVLEHFKEPYPVLEELAEHSGKYLAVFVPFREYKRVSEHFFTFDYDSFPEEIGGMKFEYMAIIDCADEPGSSWSGAEMLVVYRRLHEA